MSAQMPSAQMSQGPRKPNTKTMENKLQEFKGQDLCSIVDWYSDQVDRDSSFWAQKTARPLAALLEPSGYSDEAKFRNLVFYLLNIVPYLGPGANDDGSPPNWKSFMTDHFCPVELSWEWGTTKARPLVRFSFEPIGPFAGTELDPFNQYAPEYIVRKYESTVPTCDTTLYNSFVENLLTFNRKDYDESHQSRTFFAFDYGENDVMLKGYFMPSFRAKELGISSTQLISNSMRKLPNYTTSYKTAYEMLSNFIESTQSTLGLQSEILAFDCVEPEHSRLKIYMRSRTTSWNSVRSIVTLGGQITHDITDQGMKELEHLWKFVLGLDESYQDDQELPQTDHRTAGILYYVEMRPGHTEPSVKVYIPIRHYARSDIGAAKGLKAYMEEQGRGDVAQEYIEALKSFGSPETIENQTGVQTYLGCSIAGDKLKIISYVSPRAF